MIAPIAPASIVALWITTPKSLPLFRSRLWSPKSLPLPLLWSRSWTLKSLPLLFVSLGLPTFFNSDLHWMFRNQNWVQICTEYFKICKTHFQICTQFVEMLLYCCSSRLFKPTTSYRWTGWVRKIIGVWGPLFQDVLCVVVSFLSSRIWWIRSHLLWVADGDVNNCSIKS